MKEIIVTVKVSGVARGMFPIGKVTELFYQMIDYLESRDVDGMALESKLPINRTFQESGAEVHLVIEQSRN